MTTQQRWSRCPGDGLPVHPDDQAAIARFARHLQRSPADRLDYDAGVALWDARQARIRQAMQATTERRLKDAGIRSDDPALAAIRQYNAALGIGPPEPAAGRPGPSRQPTDLEAAS